MVIQYKYINSFNKKDLHKIFLGMRLLMVIIRFKKAGDIEKNVESGVVCSAVFYERFMGFVYL